jgi:4-diphosphocytidyl-2-C-methyl-D-erythritol kinase
MEKNEEKKLLEDLQRPPHRDYVKYLKKSPSLSCSYAKINLFLDVLGRMENGYHSISTLFSEIELFDTIKFSLTKYHDIKILSTEKSLQNRANLIYQIAIFIQDKYCVRYGAKINLGKNIPISAGLGGGSSNGASTIIGLDKLWQLNMSVADMHSIAAQFGSDINFFLDGYQAVGSGRGEIITQLDESKIPRSGFFIDNILLVNPRFPIMSREAYELLEIGDPNPNLHKLIKTGDVKYCYNKLEDGICKKYPVISQIIQQLYDLKAKKAMLSGSGPTIIGFFPDISSIKKAQKVLEKASFWTHITSTRRRPLK